MFLQHFSRIFWKECRANRALWLSCLATGMAIQLLIWWLILDTTNRVQGLIVSPVLYGVLFAVACGAVLFAGEREERTNDWLLTLSARTDSLLIAKFLFAIAATLSLQAILALVSLNLVLLSASATSDTRQALKSALLPAGLPVLVWTILGSLLSRRVLISIPASIAWYFVSICVVGFVVWIFTPVSARMSGSELPTYLTLGIVCALPIVADVWIGWFWSRGRYLDGTVFEWVSEQASAQWQRLVPRVATAGRLPRKAEFEQPSQRMWQRLVWQERHRDSIHLAFLFVLCLMVVGTTIVHRPWSRNGPPPGPVVAVLVTLIALITGVLPFMMGILSFRESRQPSFLWDHGIDPKSVWLSKQAVWLPRIYWIPLAIVAVAVISQWMIRARYFVVPSEVQSRWGIGFWGLAAIFLTDGVPVLNVLFWSALLSYACGQMMSIVFRRVILAIGGGLLLNFIGGAWVWGMVALQVPLWWSVGLPAFVMVAVTRWQTRPWLADEHSWRRYGQLGAVSIVLPTVMVALLATYRIGSVFLIAPFPQNLDSHKLISSWDEKASLMFRPLLPDELVARERLERLGKLHSGQRLSIERADWDQDADEIVALLKADMTTLNRPLSTGDFMFSVEAFQYLQSYLENVAQSHQDAGHLDKSLQCRLASLKLARLLATRNTSSAWCFTTTAQAQVLQGLNRWSNHPSQSSSKLREAVDQISAELQRFPSLASASVADYVLNHQRFVLPSDREFLDAVTENVRNPEALLAAEYARLPWERQRYARLLMLESQIDFQECLILENSEFRNRLSVGDSSRRTKASSVILADYNEQRNHLEPLFRTTFQPQGDHLPYWMYYENRTTEVLNPMKELVESVNTR